MNATKHLLFIALAFCAGALAPAAARGGLFKITNRTYGTGNQATINQIDALFNRVENGVNDFIPDADSSRYLRGVSDSTVIAGKGIGVDYANKFDMLLLGATLGVGVDLGDNPFSDLINGDVDGGQVSGFGMASGIVLGLNLGIVDALLPIQAHRFNVFVNYMALDVGDFEDDLHGDVESFGVHLSYHLIDPFPIVPLGMFKWGGIQLTAGYEYNHFDFLFVQPVRVSQTDTVNGGDATARFDGTASLGGKITTHSIPIEISTHVQLAYFLTLFGGVGYDMNSGETESIANLLGDVTLTGGGVPAGAGGDALLDLGDEDGPSETLIRGFVGAQVNLWMVKLTAQVHRAFSKDLWSANVGLRVVW